MTSCNLKFIAISCVAIFFGAGFLKANSFFPASSLSFKKNTDYLIVSDSTSDSTKKDSTNVPQLIEVGSTEITETELKPQNELDKFAEDSIFLITDKPVEYFEGEMDLFYRFIAYNVNYPEAAKRQKQEGKIYVRFVVNKNGSVSKAESVRGEHDILKREAERVIRLTKWIPAQINGQNVRSLMTIPITFKLGDSQKITPKQNPNEEVSIAEVDEIPTFENGMKEFGNYIAQNLIYPKEAKKIGEQGKVIIEFAVEINGNLSDFKIIQSVGSNCDAEVLRLFKNSPKWIPAKKEGQNVKTRISYPIAFKLD